MVLFILLDWFFIVVCFNFSVSMIKKLDSVDE